MRILMVFTIFLLFSCEKEDFPRGTWFHAYEVKKAGFPEGAMIYRNTDYFKMPPARFRHFFKYVENKKCETNQLASNDKHEIILTPCNYEEGFISINNVNYKILSLTKSEMVLVK